MLIFRNRVMQLFGLIPLVDNVDVIPRESETVKNADISKVNENGMDRLRRMYSLEYVSKTKFEFIIVINSF